MAPPSFRWLQLVLLAFAVLVTGGLGLSVYDARWGEPGEPAVYERIRAETDCAVLRTGLQRAEASAAERYSQRSVDDLYEVARSYARTYNERLAELDC